MVIQGFHWCHGSKKWKNSAFKAQQIRYQGWLAVQNPAFSQNTQLFLKGAGLTPPLKDCIQAAASYGGMHVGKQASKKVAPLKQNITPPATDDTPLFTHSLAPRICFTLTFIWQDASLKLHSLESSEEKWVFLYPGRFPYVAKYRNHAVKENRHWTNLLS